MTFLQNWSAPYLTSADNLLQLKRAGASDAILDAFAKRGAELRLRQSTEHPEKRQSVIILPSAQASGSGMTPLGDWAPPYPFSDALYLWANWYPLPYPGPGYAFGYWSYPRRWR